MHTRHARPGGVGEQNAPCAEFDDDLEDDSRSDEHCHRIPGLPPEPPETGGENGVEHSGEPAVARNFKLVESQLLRSAPQRSGPEIATAARVLWSGVHGVCILGLTQRLGGFGEASLDELVESLISNYLAGFCSP